ncbi:MAG: 2,3-bisphosphoglycerate-independent phosphoglycerate mutase [Alphaproteobacteria bacterium]
MKPIVLCVLDGWGIGTKKTHNAIAQANTPTFDKLLATYPNCKLQASAEHVGLPKGQMGNSEVGHINLGAGRIVRQDLPRIDQAVKDNTLKDNSALCDMIAKLQATGGKCHLMGLLSPGGVHSHQDHILALCKILEDNNVEYVIHAFLDGRDTPPKSAEEYLKKFSGKPVATIAGRYYAMDRDQRWDRIELAYNAIVGAKGPEYPSPRAALKQSYADGVTDEFVLPCVLKGYQGVAKGDAILMANFRADRARQILTALLDPSFEEFHRDILPDFTSEIGLVEYSADLGNLMETMFIHDQPQQTLGEIVSGSGMHQLRIAETEKYAHVTFFFNGGREEPFNNEDRILVPSPKVATYDLQPEMAAEDVTNRLVDALLRLEYDFVLVNFANADMVGHTGDMEATIKAVEYLDQCLDKLYSMVKLKGGTLLITADHGNADQMQDPTSDKPHTAHTNNPVPFVLVNQTLQEAGLRDGALCDVAPTILDLFGITKPILMTGESLIRNLNTENIISASFSQP